MFLSGNCLEREIQACLDPIGTIRGDFFLRKPLKYTEFEYQYTLIKKKIYDRESKSLKK